VTQDEFNAAREEAEATIMALLESEPYQFIDWEQRDVLRQFVAGLSVMDPMIIQKLRGYLEETYHE
jgi:hypothetical protein